MKKIDVTNPRLSFAQVQLTVAGLDLFAKSVSYADGIDRADVEGNARIALGRTAGVYKADECTLELYIEDFNRLTAAIQKDSKGFYDAEFTVSVGYAAVGETEIQQDVLVACQFTKRAANDQSGPDALTRTLTFKPLYIKFGNQMPLSNMPDGAS